MKGEASKKNKNKTTYSQLHKKEWPGQFEMPYNGQKTLHWNKWNAPYFFVGLCDIKQILKVQHLCQHRTDLFAK